MKRDSLLFALAVILLLVIFPLAAGCLSVPGPEGARKTTPVTAAVTRSPQATASPAPPATPPPAQVTTRAPVVTPSLAVATQGKAGYAAATCTDQGGFLVVPGQQCNGSWLPATNTFSCCSVQPVSAAGSNRSIQAAPFTLTVNIDDNLGSITP